MRRHLIGAGLVSWFVLAAGECPAAEPEVGKIDALIEKLGSEKFPEREAASKALEAIGNPALAALRRAAIHSEDAETRRRARLLVSLIENPLDTLLAAYRDYGLLLPPRDAELVRVGPEGALFGPDGEEAVYVLGFLLQSGDGRTPPRVLVGTQVYEPGPMRAKPEPIRPEAVDLKHFYPCGENATFSVNAGLATAIQCQARGWHRLAGKMLTWSVEQECGHHHSLFYQPADVLPKTALAHLAWAHWCNEIARPGTDRAVIARRMKALLDAEPEFSTRPNRLLVRDLEAALRLRRSTPGSIEALIDGLVDVVDEDAPDTAYSRLADMGFAAVPDLIAHLDDDRLTRCVMNGFHNFPPWHMRVGDVVSDLLEGLGGEDVNSNGLRKAQGYRVEKAAAQSWWEAARKAGRWFRRSPRVPCPARRRSSCSPGPDTTRICGTACRPCAS
jgi:hypothetical protein